jgi:hypothetical protein
MESDDDALPTASTTFPTTPDLDMVVPTLPDICRHPALKMSATKPEVEITFEFPTSGYVG